jgi:NADPH:quinone reductase-like Zn-dependent oxidoreductase
VQIAKARGGYVIGTGSAAKHEFLRGLGVDETIDYTSDDVGARASDVDAVLDAVGGDAAADALPAVRDGGIVVTLSGASVTALRERAGRRVRIAGILVEPDRVGMEAIAELVATDALRPHVAQTFLLAKAARAHELGEAGRTQGKLVLTVG